MAFFPDKGMLESLAKRAVYEKKGKIVSSFEKVKQELEAFGFSFLSADNSESEVQFDIEYLGVPLTFKELIDEIFPDISFSADERLKLGSAAIDLFFLEREFLGLDDILSDYGFREEDETGVEPLSQAGRHILGLQEEGKVKLRATGSYRGDEKVGTVYASNLGEAKEKIADSSDWEEYWEFDVDISPR